MINDGVQRDALSPQALRSGALEAVARHRVHIDRQLLLRLLLLLLMLLRRCVRVVVAEKSNFIVLCAFFLLFYNHVPQRASKVY